ncbi:MAG: hypothetical protein KA354_08460 [Phycisphaerae bacterium]|nr:hypothetical protein [Phycisphaerae bacterium]
MSRTSPACRCVIAAMAWSLTCGGTTAVAQTANRTASRTATTTASAPAKPSAAEIRQAVRQLKHPSPAKRREAIRQLAAWGPITFPELHTAAQGNDLEAALSARTLLNELQAAIMLGGRVRLEVVPARVAWNEPFTLILHAHNPGQGPMRVPWPDATKTPTTRPASPDADQVGRMLDAADWLRVTGPDHQPLELRIDSIDGDADIRQAVDLRAGKKPPAHTITPGSHAQLRIPEFNRGWSRYPMLAAGKHTIRFEYQPQWEDESWTEAGFGRVTSEPVTVEVTRSAPDDIRMAERPLHLQLKRQNHHLVAEVHNTWDRPLSLNLNFGPDSSRHAQLVWDITIGTQENTRRWQPDPDPAAGTFRLDRLKTVDPGGTLEIAQAPIPELARAGEETETAGPNPRRITLRYMQGPSPVKMRELYREQVKPSDVPSNLFSGVVVSEPFPISPDSSQ